MQIDQHKCVACSNCIAVCPVGAIYIDPLVNRATVNLDECVECYACHNRMSKEDLNPTLVRTIRGFFKLLRIRFDPEPDVCPTSAFAPQKLAWPRSIRQAFSHGPVLLVRDLQSHPRGPPAGGGPGGKELTRTAGLPSRKGLSDDETDANGGCQVERRSRPIGG